MDLVIRDVRAHDHEAILGLVNEAFGDGERGGRSEVEIVETTWSLGANLPGLELVATDEGRVVGHVLGARADLEGRAVVGIAPLSVAPSRQRTGIGSAIVTELLRRADDRAWPLVVVLGDPGYYGRFGFEPAGRFRIFYGPAGDANPHFQAHPLSGFDESLQGEVRYCWELATD
jgi:putative acetyltransferase